MGSYYVSTTPKPNGEHEVHLIGCASMPRDQNRIHLGNRSTCHSALEAARHHFGRVNGCPACCYACHSEVGQVAAARRESA